MRGSPAQSLWVWEDFNIYEDEENGTIEMVYKNWASGEPNNM